MHKAHPETPVPEAHAEPAKPPGKRGYQQGTGRKNFG